MDAVFYVLHAGAQWETLPRPICAPSTAHRRFQERRGEEAAAKRRVKRFRARRWAVGRAHSHG